MHKFWANLGLNNSRQNYGIFLYFYNIGLNYYYPSYHLLLNKQMKKENLSILIIEKKKEIEKYIFKCEYLIFTHITNIFIKI